MKIIRIIKHMTYEPQLMAKKIKERKRKNQASHEMTFILSFKHD
jgi:hypothetical protein